MSNSKNHKPDNRQRRKSIIRTALVLFAVVLLIYLVFVGQGIWSYFAS
jgi:cell division septal protein FtsQ